MGFHGECGRGWSARCANSKGKKCRCKCGGANHGKLSQNQFTINATPEHIREIEIFGKSHAHFIVVQNDEVAVTIRDLGPWDQHPTVTNDAEWVVSQLADLVGPRPLYCYDSDGHLDQLLVRDGRFAGFAPVKVAS